jgi:hypothetical protein
MHERSKGEHNLQFTRYVQQAPIWFSNVPFLANWVIIIIIIIDNAFDKDHGWADCKAADFVVFISL